jgi:hypothetical protein
LCRYGEKKIITVNYLLKQLLEIQAAQNSEETNVTYVSPKPPLMRETAPDSENENLQQQLVVIKGVYEEMITSGESFERVKPVLIQIRELEKSIQNIT